MVSSTAQMGLCVLRATGGAMGTSIVVTIVMRKAVGILSSTGRVSTRSVPTQISLVHQRTSVSINHGSAMEIRIVLMAVMKDHIVSKSSLTHVLLNKLI